MGDGSIGESTAAGAAQVSEVTVNGDECRVPVPCTVAELLERLGLPQSGVAVARDEAVLPRSQWGEQVTDGARYEVLTAVQGG